MGDVEPLTAVESVGPSPPLSTQLLVVFGFVGVVAWIVNDASTGTGEKYAHVVMLLTFGACLCAGALLL